MDGNANPTSQFVTNVGLVTSRGPHGDNVMACEWTHQISYEPPLIIIAIRKIRTTYDNILSSKEFGLNIAATDQNWVSSISGNTHGIEYDKVEALQKLGVEFYPAKKIAVPMILGSAANLECKLERHIDIGDHPLFIGRIVEGARSEKPPLLYHLGKYWFLGDRLPKVPQEEREERQKVLEKYRK